MWAQLLPYHKTRDKYITHQRTELPSLLPPPGWGTSRVPLTAQELSRAWGTRHWYKNPLPNWYFPQAAGRTLTLLLEAPLCGITQLISPGANGVQPVRPWFGRAWGVICKALLCNEPAGKLSLTHWEKAIPNLLLTREHHIIEWTLQFSQDH